MPDVVFAGRYPGAEILPGPLLTAKNLFESYTAENKSVFIQYFFDGRKYSIWKKLFRMQALPAGNGSVMTCGIMRIIPLLRQLKPEVLHLTGFERFAVIFFIYRMLFKLKIIYNSHGIIRHENEAIKKLKGFTAYKDKFCEKIFLKYSDKIIFPSLTALETAKQYYELNENKFSVIPNSVDDIFYTVSPFKGTNTPLKAVMMVKNTLNFSGLSLIKEALTAAELPVEIIIITDSDTGISNSSVKSVKPMGHPALAKLYSDKDIFLSLNSYDTFSISTAEAMASGLIPVVTVQTGISSYIKQGENGFIVSNSKELQNTLENLSKLNEAELTRIKQGAKSTSMEFKSTNINRMYSDIYKELAG